MSAPAAAGDQADNTWSDNLLELVRYEFTVDGEDGEWILFRMLPPVWFDDVAG